MKPGKGKEAICLLVSFPLLDHLLKDSVVDTLGNVHYRGTKNFNMVMAMAADLVIVEAENVAGIWQ